MVKPCKFPFGRWSNDLLSTGFFPHSVVVSLWFSARSWRSNWATSRGGAWPSLQRSRMIRDDPDESELEAMAQSKSWIYPAIKYWMCPSFVYHVYQRVNHVKIQFVMFFVDDFDGEPPMLVDENGWNPGHSLFVPSKKTPGMLPVPLLKWRWKPAPRHGRRHRRHRSDMGAVWRK